MSISQSLQQNLTEYHGKPMCQTGLPPLAPSAWGRFWLLTVPPSLDRNSLQLTSPVWWKSYLNQSLKYSRYLGVLLFFKNKHLQKIQQISHCSAIHQTQTTAGNHILISQIFTIEVDFLNFNSLKSFKSIACFNSINPD